MERIEIRIFIYSKYLFKEKYNLKKVIY